ncbi:hypothetical protein SK128_004508, partial [Halocaridina rubra]
MSPEEPPLALLTTKAVQSTSLALQSIHHIHSSDSLPLGMFSVSDCITNDIFEEYLEDTSSLFVDEARNTLDTTSTSKATNSRLGDALDVVTKNLTMAFSAPFTQAFTSLAASCHDQSREENAAYGFSWMFTLEGVRTFPCGSQVG